MKGAIRYFLLLALSCSIVAGCAGRDGSVLNRLDKFVTLTEKKADAYSAEEWELNEAQYEKLIDSLERDYDNMTREQKDRALKAIGRYNGLLAKYSIQKSYDVLEEISKALPSLIEGFTGAFDDSVVGKIQDDAEDSSQDPDTADEDVY